MSELTTTARPYARAVFEMASESKDLAGWSELLAFMGAMAANEDVQTLLASPKMTKQSGADAFIALCDKKLNDKAESLVRMLAENDRLSLLPEMRAIYESLKNEVEGLLEAHVVAAKKLTKAEESSIAAALKKRFGRDVKLKVSVDESLLGGAIIRAGDLVMDGSLKGRLNKMTTVMTG